MRTENDRIKEVRRAVNLTLEKFGERIGMKKSSLSQVENGTNSVSNQLRNAVCREFNVSETWLRTGEGEMFRERSTEDILMEFAKDVSYEGDESFKKRFITAIAQMDDEGWSHFEKWLTSFLEKYLKPVSAAAAVDPDKEAEEYRQELLVQKSPEERSKASDGTEEKDA